MFVALLENGSSIRKFANVFSTLKKIIPAPGVGTTEAEHPKELERLALSAPHVLADIGFERDLRASSSEKAVWRRGAHCVTIYSTKHATAVT